MVLSIDFTQDKERRGVDLRLQVPNRRSENTLHMWRTKM